MNTGSPHWSGMLLFDKPKGITSHDAVDLLRRHINFRQIGHTGTLDPMATGLLVMLLGPATKYQAKLQNCAKVYSGAITLGIETDTWDAEGKVLKRTQVAGITQEKIKNIIGFFTGKVVQQVPSFSAVRYRGKHLYKLARKNTAMPAIRREVNIKWNDYSFRTPVLRFELECSGGTYVRSIAYEMGRMLGSGGHLSELRRLSVNRWLASDALDRETLQKLAPEAVRARLLEVPPDLKNL